ncbi:hypothetical protein QQF64_017773 [Cirrhinus molitorella]|uniref:Uncharacterized protein n=1 Tax=Cirrhinus molitorella TaxID=172907 RepID=A0ABR3LL02_9TELE
MVAHGGRADSSRGLTDRGGLGGGGTRGGEPMTRGDAEDPEGQGGADGAGNKGGYLEIRGTARATEYPGGAEGKSPKEPVGQSNEAQTEE